MKSKLKIIALSFALGFFSQMSGASAQIHITIAPPAPIIEVQTAPPYAGAVWIGGYYDWDPVRTVYVWRPGRWGRPPRGRHVWVAPRYRHVGGEYRFHRGRWR